MDCRKLRRLLVPIIIALTLLSSAALHAEIYQWRDANGKLHFGDRPPQEEQAEEITPSIQTPQSKSLSIKIRHQEFTLSGGLHEETLTAIEHIYARYQQDFGLDLHGTAEVNLYLFADQEGFAQWMEERGATGNPNYAGVFLPATNEVAVWRWSKRDEQVAQTILHEASHVLLFQMSPASPVWLHEGLAQYFQTLKVQENGQSVVTALPDAEKRIQTWIKDEQLITMRQYLSLDDRSWRDMAHQLNAIPYTVAWGATAFLMSKPVGRSTLRQLLQDLEKTDRRPTLQRITHLYPGGISRLEYDFFKWAQQGMQPQWF